MAPSTVQLPKLDEITIGADPELFLISPQGKYISSIGLIGGSKLHPRPIGGECFVQEDNVAVEFNIPPATCVEEFIASTTSVLEYLTKHALEKGLLLSIIASKSFDEDQLQHPRARMFGCETDFNAWTKAPNDAPKAVDKALRTAGGHIHFGGIKELSKLQLVRWCDITMGLHSVLEDEDTRRRELYGMAGSFRPKPYGLEYRVLSNYWLQTPTLMQTVYERALEAVDRVLNGWEVKDAEGARIQGAIDKSDKKEAETLLAEYAA